MARCVGALGSNPEGGFLSSSSWEPKVCPWEGSQVLCWKKVSQVLVVPIGPSARKLAFYPFFSPTCLLPPVEPSGQRAAIWMQVLFSPDENQLGCESQLGTQFQKLYLHTSEPGSTSPRQGACTLDQPHQTSPADLLKFVAF